MKDETKDHMDSTASQFRLLAGLPERTEAKPGNYAEEPSELRRFAEPEGGYAGAGETEVDERAGKVDEEYVEELQFGEELSAKSGLGNTTGVDASTGPTVAAEKLLEDGEPVTEDDEDEKEKS
jgi:hypothetical protein